MKCYGIFNCERGLRRCGTLLGIFVIEYLAMSSIVCPNYADFRCTRVLMPPHRLSTFAIRCVWSQVHLLAHEWSPLAFGIVHGFS